jgi:hypothetical protein
MKKVIKKNSGQRGKALPQRSKTTQRNLKEREFRKYLEEIEDPRNNREMNYGLPKNPTPTQIAKYKLCKKMLAYQQDHDLSDEEIAKRIGFGLSPAEVEDILYCCIDKFTLDRLTEYASALLAPCEVEINVKESEKKTSRRKTVHARSL